MSSSFNRITVLGASVLGAQISFQIAYSGFEVTTYDISDAALKQARQRFDGIAAAYPAEGAGATAAAVQETIERIRFTSELAAAVPGADLVIEAVPESLELKRDVFARIAAFAPPAAVVVTNSSTLLPSDLMDSTGRPDRFLALHFANHIWVNNIAEVMVRLKPIGACTSGSSLSPKTSAWFRSSCTRNSPATSLTLYSGPC
jgi:3-hydroxyacyl-CoA dehydrogenase